MTSCAYVSRCARVLSIRLPPPADPPSTHALRLPCSSSYLHLAVIGLRIIGVAAGAYSNFMMPAIAFQLEGRGVSLLAFI
jgi:hypothetical protein